MVGKIAHLGIAVKDLAAVSHFYGRCLGLPVSEEDENDQLKWLFVPMGETSLEFIQSKEEATPIARFIEKRGEGIHHVAIEVEDIEELIRSLKARGIPLIDERPRPGAHDSLIAFIHPKAAQGVLIEMVQPAKTGA